MNLDKILVLSGDGIGPSITHSAERVLALFDSIEILRGEIGQRGYESTGSYIPHETLDLIDECKVILSGPVNPPENVKDPLASLKVQLDLYSRGRFYRTLAPDLGVEGIDITLWSSYNNIASEIAEVKDFEGITISKYIRNDAYSRMMSIALSDCEVRGLKHVACLTREDFFPMSSGMFLDAFDTVFSTFDGTTDKYNVKDWMSHVVKNPKQNDCIVCVDLYNQIVAGLLSGIAGNENLFPTVYKGTDYALYEPNFSYKGNIFEEGYENPTSAILATSIILKNLGMKEESESVLNALEYAYNNGKRTPDVGGTLTAEEFTDAVISRI